MPSGVFGRSLARSPRFLLLDEPAGGLTVAEIGHLEAVIAAIAGAGVGVLPVEQLVEKALR